jgi:hypothetical protein
MAALAADAVLLPALAAPRLLDGTFAGAAPPAPAEQHAQRAARQRDRDRHQDGHHGRRTS